MIDPYLGTIDAPPTVESGFEYSGYPHGTLMLVRRACAEQVGIFDERYFAYCEESESPSGSTRPDGAVVSSAGDGAQSRHERQHRTGGLSPASEHLVDAA